MDKVKYAQEFLELSLPYKWRRITNFRTGEVIFKAFSPKGTPIKMHLDQKFFKGSLPKLDNKLQHEIDYINYELSRYETAS